MKKLFVTLFAMGVFALISDVQAQNSPSMSKEDKTKMKAKKEEDLSSALAETGLTKDQQDKVREVLKDADDKGKEVKMNDALTDEEKAAKKDEINNSKNDKLKEIMGADKFKLWSDIRKKQKQQNMPPPAAPTPPAPPAEN